MAKQLILDQITLCGDGSIGIRWLKQFVDDTTGEVLFSEPHRGVVDFDGDVDAQIAAVAADLQQKGYPVALAKHRALVRKVDVIGKADPDITAKRAEKVAAKAAAEAARAAKGA